MTFNLRNPLHFVLALLMSFALSACGTMQKPITAQDYVQSAKGQVTAAYKSVGDLKAAGAMTGAEASAYIAKIDPIRQRVLDAEKLVDGGADITTAQGALKTSLALLLTIESELKAKGK